MESKELKPCPFCGEEAGINEDNSYGLPYSISCFKGCGDGDLWFKTKDEAVLHWNTRPIEAAQQQRIDRLVELLLWWKATVEPFPIVSDLKSIATWLKEKDEKVSSVEAFKKHEAKNRKLYRDTQAALKAAGVEQ